MSDSGVGVGGQVRHIRTIEVSAIDLETLIFIHNDGPIWDGNLPSKSARDRLFALGLVEKVVSHGQEGFQACSYRGREFLRAMKEETNRLKFK